MDWERHFNIFSLRQKQNASEPMGRTQTSEYHSKTMGTKGSYYQSVSEIQKQIPKWKEKVNKEVRETKENAGGRYISHYFSQWWRQGTC